MKKLSLWLASILVVCLSFFAVACKKPLKQVDEVTLNETAITLEVGETFELQADTNVTDGVEWSTDKESVATVEDGVVTAVAAGTAQITARAGNAKATCTVTVEEKVVQEYAELTVDETIVELKEGGKGVTVTAQFTVNDEVYECEFKWKSEDEAIAMVEDGKIIPVSAGSTVVTVSVEYKGETYSADIAVEVKPDEYIQVSKGTIELALVELNGDIISDTFTATAYKAGEENTEVTLEYVSSDETVATVTVEDGVATVTSVGEGTCTISVFYTSEQGKIETLVSVTVARSRLTLDETMEIPYVEGNTVFDFNVLEVQGTIDGVYFNGEKVDGENGVLNVDFVEANKGIAIPVEVRTNVAIYEAELFIVVPYKAEPKQEVGTELVDMPTYDGDATTLGFPAGTEKAYEIKIGSNAGTEGWTKRMITNVATDKDAVAFDVIITESASSDSSLTMWPATNVTETQGSYTITALMNNPSADADFNRKVFVLGADNEQPNVLTTGTLYTVYFFINRGETHVHFSMFAEGVLHVANIRCIDADEIVNDPTLPPPPISQGERHNPMPTYDGDVTALGFAEGTTVYQIVGPQSNANDVKLVAQVDASGDMAYAKMDFVLSADTSSLGMWITAATTHLGYYTITPTGFSADGIGDPEREIFVRDVNGAEVQSFEAGVMYTLYVGLDGREATVQLTTWADLTIYVANVACITVEELPFEPTLPPVVEGEELSILFIGNSFSDDTEAYIVDMLLELGYTNIDVGNLYIGGCDIDTHYYNITNNVRAYDFRMRSHNGRKYTEYVTTTVGGQKQSLAFAIAYKDWDIISVQQASGYSGMADTYNNLDALVDEVRSKATNPDVEFVFNMTWAYQADSTHTQFPDYNSDQMTMYNAIIAATQEKVSYSVVPNATSIQNARTSLLGDTLTRDGYHLNLQIGRFIAGLTFVAKVTGADITDFAYAPNGVTSKQLEIAIESVQNAIANPFEITQSQVKEDVIVEKDVMPGGSNPDAVKEYEGDVTELGFAEGTTVFEYVGVNSDTDKVAIKVDSANYDYVEVQFVITSGDGYFFMFGRKGDSWHNGGASYVIDPSWIRIADGNNTPSDRTIEIFDADGNKVTSLMSTNTLYTLRVFTKVGELDQILIGKNGSTIYFANVTQGLEADLPEPEVEGAIKQGDGASALPNYKDDVTAHGFAEGEYVQYMVTETVSNVWGDKGATSGMTREQLAARIPGEVGKYVTIKFATSEDIASGSVFYVWGLKGTTHTINGDLNFTTTTYGRILDVDGNPITSIAKNTVYVLELYMEGTDTYKVSNIVTTGMEMYFATNSITYSDKSIAVQLPGANDPITAGGSNSHAVKEYKGDVTELGFAEGTTVFEYVGVNSDTDKVAIKVDSANYDYVEVQFVITSGDGYFFMFGRKGDSWHNGGASYVIDPSWIRIADGNNTPSDRTIEIFDADGNKVTSLMSTNTLYTLRVFTKVGELDQILIGKNGSTIYFANVTQGLEADLPEPEVEGAIKQGDGASALPNYKDDVTAHGFAEGEYVQYMVTETVSNVWGDKGATSGMTREQLAARIPGEVGKYVTIKFATSEDIASGSVFYVWGLKGTTHTINGGLNFTTTTYGRILDLDGYPVTSIAKNTVYVLELYMEGTDTYKVSNIVTTGMELYFATNSITYSDKSMAVQLPGASDPITAGGSNKNAVIIYNGDETALGFVAGSKVYKYVGETTNDKISIKVDSTNYDYVDVQMVLDAACTKTWFLGFVMSGSSYLNGADAYILSGDNIRFNANASNPLDRKIQFLDAEGNVVSSALETGVVYTLRVYIKANNVTEIQMRQVGVTAYLANVTHGIEEVISEPEGPVAVDIKIGDDKAEPTLFEGDVTMYGFAEGTAVAQMALEAKTDVDDKRLALAVDSSMQYLAIDFSLEFGLLGNIYVWTVTAGGERVLAATILAEGGLDTDPLVNIVIKDSAGNDVTNDVLIGLDSGAAEKYTLYVYYNGADEVHIGCDDFDEEFGGNILYFANAQCTSEEA